MLGFVWDLFVQMFLIRTLAFQGNFKDCIPAMGPQAREMYLQLLRALTSQASLRCSLLKRLSILKGMLFPSTEAQCFGAVLCST